MDTWVLKIELDGEWEECTFEGRHEALTAFIALAQDYEVNLKRAVLFPHVDLLERLAWPEGAPNSGAGYLN